MRSSTEMSEPVVDAESSNVVHTIKHAIDEYPGTGLIAGLVLGGVAGWLTSKLR